MAIREIRFSDLTGEEIPEGKEVRVIVRGHPQLDGRRVQLDVSFEDVGGLEEVGLDVVTLELKIPNETS